MKKLLLSLMGLFIAIGMYAGDTTVTFDFSAQGYSNGQTMVPTKIDAKVTASFDKGTNSNAPKYYNTGTAVRLYGGNTMTLSTNSGVIKSVTFTFSSGEGTNEITVDNGTFDSPAWTGSDESVTFTIGGTTGHRRVKAIEITYGEANAAPVAVEGVNITDQAGNELNYGQFNPYAMTVGESLAIKAVVTPNNATNKKVTWEVMQDTEVISLTNGVVKALAPGKAAVVATTEDGEKQAYVYIYVSAPQQITVAEFLAAEGKIGYLVGQVGKIENSTYGNFNLTDETGTVYVYGCLTPEGEAKQFASLGIAEGDYIKVLASEYKLYGETQEAVNVTFVEKVDAPAAPTTFDISFSDGIAHIVPSNPDVTYSVAVYNPTIANIFELSGIEVETYEDVYDVIGSFGMLTDYACTGESDFDLLDFMEYMGEESLLGDYTLIVAECEVDGWDVVRTGDATPYDVTVKGSLALAATDGEKNYSTFSSYYDVVFENAEVYTVSVVDGSIVLTEVANKYVPACTGVLVASTASTATYSVAPDDAVSQIPADNLLMSYVEDMEGDNKFYKLAYGNYSSKTNLGFYWGAANGAAFDAKEGGAYLAVPASAAIKGFLLSGGTADAILSVEGDTDKVIYNAQGQRIQKMQKGINIVNGRKVIF